MKYFERMARRIPKTRAPEGIDEAHPASSFGRFARVYVPAAKEVFTYGVREVSVRRGSVVWAHLKGRAPALALVAGFEPQEPNFPLKEVVPHASGYAFPERYMETLEWCSRYYASPVPTSLKTFWPADFQKFLDALLVAPELPPKIFEKSVEPPLTEEQEAALKVLLPKVFESGFRGALLHGVTGSGKTRVYEELAGKALEAGRKVLILVPEIGLTPQNAKRFSAFLGEEVVVLHSSVSAAGKLSGWLKILRGEARIVLGTRSALLTPFAFDMVVLDEEHDTSFKQSEQPPLYNCRELSFHIAYKFGAFVLLGSATPSLETFAHAKRGNLAYVELKTRATSVSLPKVEVVDMKKNRQQRGIMLSAELRDSLTETLAKGNQAIILMNRRGYSKSRICSECGATFYCKHCHIPLVYHKQYKALLCHYCARLYPLGSPCPECGSPKYDFAGGAIEKLEEEISEWIPAAKILRLDRDTTQNVGSAAKILESFRARDFNVLLGTQMVAKGHDFPGVQLVGVVGAEAGSPDFRASERLFQLLSQTAGRAGRASEGGKVILQTRNPGDRIFQFATLHDYKGFAEAELEERREAAYPPYKKLAMLEVGARSKEHLEKAGEAISEALAKAGQVEVLGPAEAFISKVNNVYWLQFLLKADEAKFLREALAPLEKPQKLGVHSSVQIKLNIDP